MSAFNRLKLWLKDIMTRIRKRRAATATQAIVVGDTTPPTVPQNPASSFGTGSTTFTIQDDGNRANGDAGSNWTDSHGNGRLQIVSQRFQNGGATYREMKWTASSPASADYSVEIQNRNDGSGARAYQVWARMTGTGGTKCGYRAEIDKAGGTYRLLQVTNNADTQLIAATAWTIADDDRIGIRVTGTTIAIIRNGAVVASATDATWAPAGTFGLGVYNPNNDLTFDDITCTCTVSGQQRIVVTADQSTDDTAVVGYRLERQVDAGAWSIIASQVSSPYYEDTNITSGHTYGYRWYAFDAAGNYSAASSTTSTAVVSGPAADSTAPDTPGVARLEEGSLDVLDAVISWAICNDTGTGTKEYDVYDVDTSSVIAVVPHPRVGSGLTVGSIGAESPAGSDAAGVLTGGGPEHWGVLDALHFKRYPVDGDYDAMVTFPTVTGRDGNFYGKGLLEDRSSVDPSTTYYAGVKFPGAGANTLKAEYRTVAGGQAAGSAEFTTKPRLRIVSRYKTKALYASSVTTVGSEDWGDPLDKRDMDVALSRLVGIGASNAAAAYADFSVTAANRVFFKFSGVAGTTKRIKIRARDFAGNQTALGPQLDVVFNAPSGGGGGGGGAGSGADHDYPRMGAYVTGGGTGGDQTYASSTDRDRIARYADVAIFGGPQPGFYAGAAQTRQQTYSDIAARAIAFGRNLYKYQYVNYNEIDFNRAGSMMGPAWWDAVDGSNWWGYVNGTSGEKCRSTWSSGLGLVNMTHFAPTRDGKYPYQWAGYHAAQKFLNGIDGAFDAAPALEGFFLDNGFWYVKTTSSNFDMARGGGGATLDDWWTGHADFITACQLYTGRRAGYNSSDLFSGSFVTYPRTQLLNLLQIGCLEGYLTGAGNLATNIPEINDFIGRHTSDAHVVVQHLGLNADGSDAFDSTPFRASRYHKCLVLMTKGYYHDAWNLNHWADSNALKMFDEVDGGALATPNFLGAAVGAPPSAPWSGPVWRREFANGWVYVTDTAATVSLTGLHRMTSTRGDPINNGASGGSVNLANRDGIIVLK